MSTTEKNVTPDPKPSRKPRLTKAQKDAAAVKARADAKDAEAEQAKLDAEPARKTPSELQADLVASVDEPTDGPLIEGDDSDGDAPSAQDAVRAKVREASAATLARRAKNEADKAKSKERKAEEHEARTTASAVFKQSVVDSYAKTGDVKATAAEFVNVKTGEPYSQMRIRRILNEAGVLTTTKRGDTSERDARIVGQIEGGVEIADIATEHGLSAQRVRGIAKKAGLVIEGATRGTLPKPGTPEWSEFTKDVADLCEKWGAALGTMAHTIRKTGSAAAS